MTKEKSCKMVDDCTNFTTVEKCSKKCEFYNPINESDVPPEIEKQVKEATKHKNEKDVNLKRSGLPKFDKIHEFLILKKHVFEIQNVSPKKIILKYKKKLNESDNIADGCYVFTDKEDKLLIPHKVFNEFHNNAKRKREKKCPKDV